MITGIRNDLNTVSEFLCTIPTHPSTAGLCSDLGDLSCSGCDGDSGSRASAAPGNTGDGRLWPADTCSPSSGSDSEDGGCDSRAERSINSSCHSSERDQRGKNVKQRPQRRRRVLSPTLLVVRTYLREQRVRLFTGRWCAAVLQKTRQQGKKNLCETVF